jgi:hypothetical protein
LAVDGRLLALDQNPLLLRILPSLVKEGRDSFSLQGKPESNVTGSRAQARPTL